MILLCECLGCSGDFSVKEEKHTCTDLCNPAVNEHFEWCVPCKQVLNRHHGRLINRIYIPPITKGFYNLSHAMVTRVERKTA